MCKELVSVENLFTQKTYIVGIPNIFYKDKDSMFSGSMAAIICQAANHY